MPGFDRFSPLIPPGDKKHISVVSPDLSAKMNFSFFKVGVVGLFTYLSLSGVISLAKEGDYRWTHLGRDASRRGGEGSIPTHPQLIWRFKSKGKFLAPAAILTNLLLIGDSRGKLICLNTSDGRREWDRSFPGAFLSAPLVSRERVYGAVSRKTVSYEYVRGGIMGGGYQKRVETEGAKIFCLDLRRGQQEWQRRFSHLIHSTPALGEEQLVFGCDDYKIYSLDLQRGTINWYFKTAAPVRSSPVICSGRVVAGSLDGRLYCLDLLRGEKQWEFKTGGEIISSPSYFAGRIWVGSGDNHVYCLDLDTSRPFWKFKTESPVDTACVIYKRNVYFTTRAGMIYCLAGGDGEVMWSYQADKPVDYSPAISSGKLVFCSRQGIVRCLDAASGKELWKYPTFQKHSAAISLGRGLIFCALRDRYLYCLGEETSKNDETVVNDEARMRND